MQVSLEDIAQRAGVARSTVSRVLNGSAGATIALATQDRVRAIADELGYRPNRFAQRLRKQQLDTVGLVVPHLRNPYFVEVVVWCQRYLSEQGFNTVLYPTMLEDWGGVTEYNLAQWAVDGVLYYGGPQDSICQLLGEALGPQMPTVYLGHLHTDEPGALAVALDQEAIGRLVGEHLLAQGHATRNAGVWCLSPPQEGVPVRDARAVGLERFCTENQLNFTLVTGSDTRDGLRGLGYALGQRVLALPESQRPGGIFCHNDLIGVGCLCALRRAGVVLPSAIGLVGCDDLPEARYQELPLTTIRQPIPEMCRLAVAKLLSQLRNESISVPTQLTLQPELVLGMTT
ncbi:LacI family DNA-binding transcriptional regulator [Armatimonas sp.]|uniref:LacI family DNA-binding transcriptional regulator n=1 Tax=Armatimonas sp. TaxID=1872638 RepID=UPI00286C8200|nr:LacI family DNA-binding transcriptional regulator [Armatimonas sp.]